MQSKINHRETAVRGLAPEQRRRFLNFLENIKSTNFVSQVGTPPSTNVSYSSSLDEARRSAIAVAIRSAGGRQFDRRVWGKRLRAAENAERGVALRQLGPDWNSARSSQRYLIDRAVRERLESSEASSYEGVIGDVSRLAMLAGRFFVIQRQEFSYKERHIKFVTKCASAMRRGFVLLCDVDRKLHYYAVTKKHEEQSTASTTSVPDA